MRRLREPRWAGVRAWLVTLGVLLLGVLLVGGFYVGNAVLADSKPRATLLPTSTRTIPGHTVTRLKTVRVKHVVYRHGKRVVSFEMVTRPVSVFVPPTTVVQTGPGRTTTRTIDGTVIRTTTLPGTTVIRTLPGTTVTDTLPGSTVTDTLPGTTVTDTLPGTTVTQTVTGPTTTVNCTVDTNGATLGCS